MLIALDFDGVVTESDPFVLLGEECGTGEQIASVLDRVWHGDLKYEDGIDSVAGLLEGLPVSDAEDALDRVQPRPETQSLLSSLHEADHHVAILSDAPERAIESCLDPRNLAADTVIANRLPTENDAFTGEIEGQLVDRSKDDALEELAVELGQPLEETIAVGDDRRDLPMLQAAGTGVGIDPTPMVGSQCDHVFPSVERLELLFDEHGIV